jgi:hypothetical protein
MAEPFLSPHSENMADVQIGLLALFLGTRRARETQRQSRTICSCKDVLGGYILGLSLDVNPKERVFGF